MFPWTPKLEQDQFRTLPNRKLQTITNARPQHLGEVQLHLIYVTPAPILAPLK
jgi:hypothetical protein